MNNLLENTELYNHLKTEYQTRHYICKNIFGNRFPKFKFGIDELENIISLELNQFNSTSGISELKNLKELSVKNIPDLSDIINIPTLSTLECEYNDGSLNINDLISISNNSNIKKVILHGKDVENITPLEALQFGDNTIISFNKIESTTSEQFSNIQSRINEVIQLISSDMSEIEKVKTIYKKLLKEDFQYDFNSRSNSSNGFLVNNTMYGPLVENKGVCTGISSALEIVLKRAGLEANACGGWLDSRPSAGNFHQWNQVKVDGEWYNLDLTNDFDKKSWVHFMKSDVDPDWKECHFADKDDLLETVHCCNSLKYDEIYREDPLEREKRLKLINNINQIEDNITTLSNEENLTTTHRR